MTFLDQKRTEMQTWTDDRVELIKKLWGDGLSASQIAGELGGITRNAVIGKVHRLGLSGRAKAPSTSMPRPRKPRPATPISRAPQGPPPRPRRPRAGPAVPRSFSAPHGGRGGAATPRIIGRCGARNICV